ncbi:MAG: PEP-CTERM sorting domain-containing protein [Rhodocyclaceae bacterium]|nr:PEP-CTERM sorting domain-containing protein [Rhodocyclaceae bacterium]
MKYKVNIVLVHNLLLCFIQKFLRRLAASAFMKNTDMKKKILPGVKPVPSALVLAFGLGAFAFPAHSALVQTTDYTFNDTLAVTDTHTTSSITNPATSATLQGTTAIATFNSSLGVLTGVSASVESSRSHGTTISATNRTSSGSASASGTGVFGAASGTDQATIAMTGNTASATFAQLSRATSCTAALGGSCSNSNSTVTQSQPVANLTVAANQLDTYVDTFGGAPALTRSAKVTDTANRNSFSSAQSTYSVGWSGTAGVTYDYLAHAGPSFAAGSAQTSNTIDFGSWLIGSTNLSPVGYSVINRLNTASAQNQVGLDLDLIQPSGDTSKLSTNAATFTNLGAGTAQNYTAAMDTSAVGSFSGVYVMKFSDQDVGAASSRFDYINRASDYTLNLNLAGRVVDHAQGSFDSSSTVTSTSLDLGRVFVNSTNPVANLSVYNAAGDRVALALNAVTGSGDTNALTTTLAPISIARGASSDALARLNTAQVGNFSATYTLALADDLGSTVQGNSAQTYSMTVQLGGQVVDHAAASFDGTVVLDTLSLDFGRHFIGDTVSPMLFDIFNVFGNDRTSLDLVSVTGSGDTDKLSICLMQFLALAPGDAFHCAAFLDTSVIGGFDATYSIQLRDNATGIGGTPAVFFLTLNLGADVVARRNATPEPNSLGLLGVSLLGVSVLSRRRKKK